MQLYKVGLIFSFFIVVLVILPRATDSGSFWSLDNLHIDQDRHVLIGVTYVLLLSVIVSLSWVVAIVYFIWIIRNYLKKKSFSYELNKILPKGYNKIIVLNEFKGDTEGIESFLSESLFMEEIKLLEVIVLKNKRRDALFALPELKGRDLNPSGLPTNFRYLRDIMGDRKERKNYPKRVRKYLNQEY